jgi:predicted DNA-binding WGR domain protein
MNAPCDASSNGRISPSVKGWSMTTGGRPVAGTVPALPLLDQVALTPTRPQKNEWRFCRMGVWPDPFGATLLAGQWGRIGSVWLDPHPDAGAAIEALAELARAKRRRGYMPSPASPGASA